MRTVSTTSRDEFDATPARPRCGWAVGNQILRDYHDAEWGVPVHDDRRLFELLLLEGAQAGLSWTTILNKRQGYALAFDNFDADRVARYDGARIQELLANPAIVRNRAKLVAAVQNAQAFLRVRERHGSFDAYVWQFVGSRPMQHARQTPADIPARTPESDAMSRELRALGFAFVGSTICYAFMQATGMVNDHIVECFRWRELRA